VSRLDGRWDYDGDLQSKPVKQAIRSESRGDFSSDGAIVQIPARSFPSISLA
jgi:hypothetical protein